MKSAFLPGLLLPRYNCAFRYGVKRKAQLYSGKRRPGTNVSICTGAQGLPVQMWSFVPGPAMPRYKCSWGIYAPSPPPFFSHSSTSSSPRYHDPPRRPPCCRRSRARYPPRRHQSSPCLPLSAVHHRSARRPSQSSQLLGTHARSRRPSPRLPPPVPPSSAVPTPPTVCPLPALSGSDRPRIRPPTLSRAARCAPTRLPPSSTTSPTPALHPRPHTSPSSAALPAVAGRVRASRPAPSRASMSSRCRRHPPRHVPAARMSSLSSSPKPTPSSTPSPAPLHRRKRRKHAAFGG